MDSRLLKLIRKARLTLTAMLLAASASVALAVGDASTRFQIFVPPNNDPVGRDSALIVTNVSPATATVDIEDTKDDGDSDDSFAKVELKTGQSQVIYIKDGKTNDDAGGKWDGDYFLITSTEPVVAQIATRSDWQWDFVPADNRTMRGQSFFIYSPSTSNSDRDLDVFAYEDNTQVTVSLISTTATNVTGKTTVDLAGAKEIFKTTLQAGEDSMVIKGLGTDVLNPGQTYWVRTSKPATVMYGALVTNARDGMAAVPSINGSSTGELFYFIIPADAAGERELRMVAWKDGTVADFAGWNESKRQWETVSKFTMDRGGHGDWVESNTSYRFYRVQTNPGKPVSVTIADWMESNGYSGTKDDTTFASAESGYGAGKSFLIYMPPPGTQSRVSGFGSTQTHLFLYGHVAGTTYTVTDADTNGSIINRSGGIPKGKYVVISISDSVYQNSLNKPANGIRPYLRVTANQFITAQASNFNDNWMTFAPSVVLPNPILTASSPVTVATIGANTTFSFTATNVGASQLAKAQIRLLLDVASSYVDATISGVSAGTPTISTDTATGRPQIVWSGFTLPAEGTITGTITYKINARRANDNSLVRNGDFVQHVVQVRGEGFGAPAAQGGESETFTAQGSVAVSVRDTAQTIVNFFSAQTIGSAITLRWQTATEPNAQLFKVYRSTTADGTYSLLSNGTVAPTGDALTGKDYSIVNSGISGSTTYFYRLDLIDTGNVTTSYGPVAATFQDTTPPTIPVITAAIPSDSSVALTITSTNPDGDLAGYEVYRADNVAGPYVKIGTAGTNGLYTDATALNGNTYHYKAIAFDTTGNKTDFSPAVGATLPTTINAAWTVAFEDQLGPSPNDWDYNDFAVIMKSEEQFAQGGIQQVTVSLEPTVRGASITNQFWLGMSASGAWSATVDVYASRGASIPISSISYSGTGRVRVPVWNDTRTAMPPAPGLFSTNAAISQTTPVLGQTAKVTITLGNPSANPSNKRHRMPYDPYLKGSIGEIHLVRENFPDSTEIVTQAGSPLFGFNTDYALAIPSAQWVWPWESRRIWNAYPNQFAPWLLSGRTVKTNWWEDANRVSGETWNNYPFVSPKAGRAAAASELPASQRSTSKITQASLPASMQLLTVAQGPVVAPLAPTLEFGTGYELTRGVMISDPFALHVWKTDSTTTLPLQVSHRARPVELPPAAEGFGPTRVVAGVPAGGFAALASFDRDSTQVFTAQWDFATSEVVKSAVVAAPAAGGGTMLLAMTDLGRLVAVTQAGAPIDALDGLFPGPATLESKNVLRVPAPVVADVDGDANLEILLTSSATSALLVGADGATIPGWPVLLDSGVTATPVITVDGTDGGARIWIGTRAGRVYCFDAHGTVRPGFPVDLGSAILASPALPGGVGEAGLSTVWVTASGVVHVLTESGDEATGYPVDLGAAVSASPVLADFDGDAAPEIVVATEAGTIASLRSNGTMLEGFPLAIGEAFQATPLVADIDFDGRQELYVATATGSLLRYTSPTASALPFDALSPWTQEGGNRAGAPFVAVQYVKRDANANTTSNLWVLR